MNSQELKTAYMDLYDYMANSKQPAYMKAFGKAMTEMFNWFAENRPDAAQEWLEKLTAIKWKNYLTQKEAETIVSRMMPKAPWGREVWNSAMDSLGLKKEEEPCYNRCALWTAMNMVYTDHAETIARNILKRPLNEVPADQLVPGIRALAIDLLCDKDGVFNIRNYFGL